jgi:CheY-like chemotaxis protein/c-di-GMP-binding flagellar brake protein YcgR
MALFSFGKDKREGGVPDLVMAYLEDAQRVRSPFFVKDGRKTDHSGVLQSLDEEAGTFNIQMNGPFAADKGAKIEFVFVHENLRLGAASRLQEVRGNTVILELPGELELQERRKQARARLNPKEGATLTGLSSLFEGVGINGILENISEGGCRVRIEKAMNIKDQKKLGIGTALVPVGHSFMIIKLNKVPRCPAVMELGGKVTYLDDSSGGLVLGIQFEKSEFAGAIRSLVSSRTGAIPSAVPPKARRKTVVDEPDDEPHHRPEKAEKPVEPPPKPPEPPKAETAPPPAPPVEAPAPSPSRNAALLRLKKRSRAVVLLASAGHGALLRDHLLDEGYGRVLLAVGWDEVVAHLHEDGVGLLLIDSPQPVLECMEMVQRLKDAGLELPPIVMAAEEVSRTLVIAAHRIGISQLLVKPYDLDDSLSLLLELQMGLS